MPIHHRLVRGEKLNCCPLSMCCCNLRSHLNRKMERLVNNSPWIHRRRCCRRAAAAVDWCPLFSSSIFHDSQLCSVEQWTSLSSSSLFSSCLFNFQMGLKWTGRLNKRRAGALEQNKRTVHQILSQATAVDTSRNTKKEIHYPASLSELSQ